MGGFEGGDEGGFWDVDTISALINRQNKQRSQHTRENRNRIETDRSGYSIRAYAKATLFVKLVKDDNAQPSLLSRCVRIDELFDTISFVPSECGHFNVQGCDATSKAPDFIHKAYQALVDYTADPDIEAFFHEYEVVVDKSIPTEASLAADASDAAAFMHLLKEVCNLVISTEELAEIGSRIDPEIPFFIHDYPSANVSGSGKIVEPVEETPVKMELYTPSLVYDAELVRKTWQEDFLKNGADNEFSDLIQLDFESIVEHLPEPQRLNDLYTVALMLYPDLKKEAEKGWYLCGVGPTFFRPLY